MKEEASTPVAAGKCMSPAQVTQTLGKLGRDGETRRSALTSLRQFVEVMDAASVPRFLAQVSETKEQASGSSRAFAISLYEDIARVHGRLIVPHIPRVMATVTRSLSSSGSSPQLQQACARVLATVAEHAIEDDGSSPRAAADVLRDLCEPLLEALTGKLEPLAAGAAVCLRAVVEGKRWGYAARDLVDEVWLKTAVSLAEKGTRTAAHMALAVALAEEGGGSPGLGGYGPALLRAGVEILTSSAMWQRRAAAAKMLAAVMPSVDTATRAAELGPVAHALENCKHDRISNVRLAVRDALRAAREVFAQENVRRAAAKAPPLVWAEPAATSPPRRRSSGAAGEGAAKASPLARVESDLAGKASPLAWAEEESDVAGPANSATGGVAKARPLTWAESATSPGSTNSATRVAKAPPLEEGKDHPTPSVIPLSPSAPSESPRTDSARPPLRATRLMRQAGAHDGAAVAATATSPNRKENLNLPARDPDVKSAPQSPTGSPLPPPPPPSTRYLLEQSVVIGTSPMPTSEAEEVDNDASSPDSESVRVESDEQEEGHLVEEEAQDASPASPPAAALYSEAERGDKKTASGRGSEKSPPRSHGVLTGSAMKHVFELKGPAGSFSRNAGRSLSGVGNSSLSSSPAQPVCDAAKEASAESRDNSPPMADSATPMRSFEDDFTPQKETPSSLASEDMVSFATPRRLVRSLQESFASPQASSSPPRFRAPDLDAPRLRGEDDFFGETTTTDMDLGTPTSTSTGWSVRTNPMASDESLRTDSDDSDHERGRPAWKKMVLKPSASPTPPAPNTPPAQETDTPEIDHGAGFRHRLAHPTSFAAEQRDDAPSVASEDESPIKPELGHDAEIIKRAQRVTCFPPCEARRLEISDSESAHDRHDVEIAVPGDLDVALGQIGQGRGPTAVAAAAEMLSLGKEGLNRCLRQTVRDLFCRSWNLWPSTALFRWRWLAVVAIPFAIALAQVVFPPHPCPADYLVPT